MCADNVSNCSDWNDRATCVLFGDGAGAAVLAEGSDLLSQMLSLPDDWDYTLSGLSYINRESKDAILSLIHILYHLKGLHAYKALYLIRNE